MARDSADRSGSVDDVGMRLVAAALALLERDGPAELTVRRIAAAAEMSTMGVYTRFGGRAGVLDAMYRRGFELLAVDLAYESPPAHTIDDALTAGQNRAPAAPASTFAAHDITGHGEGDRSRQLADQSLAHVQALAHAYRRFALAHPGLYGLMFERPVPRFDPSPAARRTALDTTLGLLVSAVRVATARGALPDDDPVKLAYLIWSMLHGMVSLDLTHAARTPLGDWLLDDPEVNDRAYEEGVATIIAGLSRRTSQGEMA